MTRNEIETVCAERDFCSHTTHANDPLPAAVGDKVLEVVMADSLALNARERGEQLKRGLLEASELVRLYWRCAWPGSHVWNRDCG